MRQKLNKYGISLLVIIVLSGLNWEVRGQDSFTFPELDSWEIKQEYPVYVPGTLWDYINGAADSYLSYGFEELYIAEYVKDNSLFKVEVYKHATPIDAFGIYSIERFPDFNFIDLGVQGYIEGPVINFLVDRYYVKIRTHDESENVKNAMKAIASSVADIIGGTDKFPENLELFPEQGKKHETEIYIGENFLGHSFLGSALTIDYSREGNDFKLFIIEKESREDCQKLIEKYFEFTGEEGKTPVEGKIEINDKYNGEIHLFWHNNLIFGTLNLEDKDLQDEIMIKAEELLK